jgi:hypothetical protein
VVKWDWVRHHSKRHGDCKHDVKPWRVCERDLESIGYNAKQLTDSEYDGDLEHEVGQPGTCDGNPALLVDFGDDVQ